MRFLLLFLLAGCTVEPADTQSVKLTLVASSAEIKAKCGNDPLEGFGCAKQHRSAINPGGACEIVAIRPRSFDDKAAIQTLGHELWHCFHGPIHN